jgi:hypothetical protein
MSRLADFQLSHRQLGVLAPIVRVVCPGGVTRFSLVDHVIDHMELSLRALPAALRAGLELGLIAYDAGAIARYGRPSTRLTPPQAERWFAFWWKSPLMPQRELAKAIKILALMAYYEMPPVKAELGYTPEAWIDKVKARRLQVYAADIRAHEASLIEPDPLPSSLAARRAAMKESA